MNRWSGPRPAGGVRGRERFVLDLLVATLGTPLPGRSYTAFHADTDDDRGIDVAFIYEADLFQVQDDAVFPTS